MVLDPHWFNADPDPSFFYLRIRIQGIDDQKLEKFYGWKIVIFFDKKLHFTYP